MPTLPELRNFLEEYRLGNIGHHSQSGTDLLPPHGFVAESQKKHWGAADEHRIALEQYEIRLNEGASPEIPSQEFRFKDVPYAVEEVWDSRVAESGLAAWCTYAPFHEAPNEYGIYIQQRGLRWLGHLFYEWSRVEDRANGFDKQIQILREHRFSETNELLFGTPSFDSRSESFEFALELLILYQWFLHQIELLATHIADITDSICWDPFYREEKPGNESRPTVIEQVAASHAARSTRLGRLAPEGLSRRVLVYRALSGRFESPRSFSNTVDKHYEKCTAIASELASHSLDGGHSAITGEIGRKLPFSRYSIDASPDQIPIYITRNEFDPDNGMQGRGVLLETDWDIIESERWKKRYKSAKPEMQQAAKNARSKLENNVKHSGFEWKPCQPENQWYFRLNQEFRGIALIDNKSERLKLLDFGEHDSPKDFGCYK